MPRLLKHDRNGSALLLVIFVISAFLLTGAFCAKLVYNSYASANAVLLREQAFCLAEAGLEKAKVNLVNNPAWFTDLPYYLEDSAEWLIKEAVGEKALLGEGSFKIVREQSKDRVYSIGCKGKAVVVLRLKFSHPPFASLGWAEL
jgi:hypothetical protein